MKLTFLGTSAGMPTVERNVTALALAIDDSKSWYLVDCGESTQHQLLRCRYTLNNLEAIFITHVHGDHMFGIPGMLTSASMQGRTRSLTIYAPDGVERFVKTALSCADVHDLPFPLSFVRTDNSDFTFEDRNFMVTSHELSHRVPSFAYRFCEKTYSTQLNTERLSALNIPRGELWGRLQKGETITLDNGAQITPEEVLHAPPKSRVAIIAGDNNRPELLLAPLKGADLLVHEATITQATLDKVGPQWMHSSAQMVAEVAQQANIPYLVLTHFSGRYRLSKDAGASSVEVIREEALKFYDGQVELAQDLKSWHLTREDKLVAF